MATPRVAPVIGYLRRITTPGLENLADGQLLARFAGERDEAAFAALVRRHGPMVFAVCRRVLREGHAAEDAFQATFLVLARKAARLREPDALAPWLYGVAYRTAVRARTEAARRRQRERRASVSEAVAPAEDAIWRDLRPLLDAEVNRLPARYREPVVLCYLAGQTNAEAARRLGCSRGTLAARLARARERLRRRLAGRGLALSAGLLAAALARPARAKVPASLDLFTARAAHLFAAGHIPAAGVISARAASLAKGVARAMLVQKLKVTSVVLLAALLAGAGLMTYRAGGGEPAPVRAESPTYVAPQVTAVPPPPAPLADDDATPYRTPNFVVTAPTPAIARQVGRAAERHRTALARLWRGEGGVPDWPELCRIRVRIADQAPACATTFAFDRGAVLSQHMFLDGPLERVLADLLPHEVTHTILAHWAGGPVPRWADEGAALLAESAASRANHEAALWKLLDMGRRIPLRQLLPLRDYPSDVVVLYAEGYSLTEFLVAQKGRPTFLDFVAQGQRDGWDQAVRECYDYRSVEKLEQAWLAHVEKTRAGRTRPKLATVSEADLRKLAGVPRAPSMTPEAPKPPQKEKRGGLQLPSGPAPIQVVVALEEGRLHFRYQAPLYYEPRTRRNGAATTVTTYELVSGMLEVRCDPEQVRVYTTKGKPVDTEDLPGLLKAETLALLVVDGPLDALHLRLVKDGTLIFVLPAALAAPPAAGPERPVPPPPLAPRGDDYEKGSPE
jgi:RNA polymerase sigma factor (sigma-70 family)